MNAPAETKGRGHLFTIGVNSFYAGLTDEDPVKWPGILKPKLYLNDNAEWKEIAEFNAIWKSLQSEYDPEEITAEILIHFNSILEDYEGGDMTYEEKLIVIFQTRLEVVNGQLVIKPK